MKRFAAIILTIGMTTAGAAAEQPEKKAAPPAKELAILKPYVGEWEAVSESVITPGEQAVTSGGTEIVRALGEFWIIAEFKANDEKTPFTGIITVGYDQQKSKYVGTFICSMNDILVNYEGTLDEQGKTLTLMAEMPTPSLGGKLSKFKDEFELVDQDHRIMRSSILMEDGSWQTFQTVNYRRTK